MSHFRRKQNNIPCKFPASCSGINYIYIYVFNFKIICFTRYFVFSIAVLPRSSGVAY